MSRRPVNSPYQITTNFAVQDSNAYFGYHSGVDYALPEGRQVLAPTSGRIHSAAWSNTGGNMIVLFDGRYYHRLMHNSAVHVATGQSVSEGQHIANVGSTGLSFGAHVHWDISDEMLPSLRPSSFAHFINPTEWISNTKGKDMPNAGDVINVFKGLLDREPSAEDIAAYTANSWDGLYYAVTNSQEYKEKTQVNDGDVQNLFKFFTGRDASTEDKAWHRGNKFKPTIYNLMEHPEVKAHQAGGYTPVAEQLYKKS